MININDVVPWRYLHTSSHGLWTWTTDAFLAVVCKYDGSFAWEVSTGDTVIGAGTATNFAEAESFTLEVIGKAYAGEHQYMRYVHDAAAHYTLADGQRRNLASLAGSPVRVTLKDDSVVEGRLQVGEWAIHIELPGEDLDIQPEYVTHIAPLR